jgi:hypothetical protein
MACSVTSDRDTPVSFAPVRADTNVPVPQIKFHHYHIIEKYTSGIRNPISLRDTITERTVVEEFADEFMRLLDLPTGSGFENKPVPPLYKLPDEETHFNVNCVLTTHAVPGRCHGSRQQVSPSHFTP